MKYTQFKSFAIAIGLAALSCSVQAQKIEDALKAINYEQFDKAKGILNKLNSPEASFLLGDVYLRQGTIDSARLNFVKINVASPYAAIGTALLAGSDGNLAQANSDLAKALTLSGKDYQALLETGKAYLDLPGNAVQNGNKALAVLNKAAALKNKDEQVYLAMGDANLKMINGGEAARNYEQAKSVNPSSAEPYAKLAKLYRQARNAVVSLQNVNQGLAKDPKYGPLYREEAETFRAADKYSNAVSAYEKYMSLTDLSISSRERYIQFLYLADNFEKANQELSALKLKVKDFNKFPFLYRLDAISDYELGIKSQDKAKLAAGLASMNQLFALKTVKPLAIDYAYLGKLQAANGNDSLAIQTFEKAIAQDSSSSDELNAALVKAYLANKNYKAAGNLYSKMVEHGDTSLANYTYAGIYTYFGQATLPNPDTILLRKADKYLAVVNKKDSVYIPAYIYRAYINGMFDKDTKTGAAEPYYQKIISLATSDPKFKQQVLTNPTSKKYLITAYEYMLYYDFQKNQKAAAREQAEKLLAIDPKNEHAEALLKQK